MITNFQGGGSPYDSCRHGKGGSRHLKISLFGKQGNKCSYCNVKMKMPKGDNGILLPNNATIEHIYNKWDIRRALEGGKIVILCCHQCNKDSELRFNKKMGLHEPTKVEFSIIKLLYHTLKRENKL